MYKARLWYEMTVYMAQSLDNENEMILNEEEYYCMKKGEEYEEKMMKEGETEVMEMTPGIFLFTHSTERRNDDDIYESMYREGREMTNEEEVYYNMKSEMI